MRKCQSDDNGVNKSWFNNLILFLPKKKSKQRKMNRSGYIYIYIYGRYLIPAIVIPNKRQIICDLKRAILIEHG